MASSSFQRRQVHIQHVRTPVRTQPMALFRQVFTGSWRSLLGWAAGLTAAMLLYLPLYPSLGGSTQMQELIDSLPSALTESLGYANLGSGAGYTQATVFGLIGFLLTALAAVSWGASALGGDEEAGRLELTLAHSVTRSRVTVERWVALVAQVLLLGVWVFLIVLVLNGPAQLQLDPGRLALTCLLLTGLALLNGSAAFFGGAVSGRKAPGLCLGAAVALLSYIGNALGNQSQGLEWLHTISPYSWAYAHEPLVNDIGPWPYLGLFGLSLSLCLASVLVLRSRDIGV